ncbi:MAG TPA: hypothetical protein DCY03_30990 [Planctomycetaceae bacterium]|uniref:hypothetical protein n=1 Tax=Gimesia maris TaxID=122 RepID=UPI000E83B670|nr:hypothetical protein [Planctomycetaceae bacterium]
MFAILQTIVFLLGSTTGGMELHPCVSGDSHSAPRECASESQTTADSAPHARAYTLPDQSPPHAIRQTGGGTTGAHLHNSDVAYAFHAQNTVAFRRNSGRNAIRASSWHGLSGISLQVLFCTWLT